MRKTEKEKNKKWKKKDSQQLQESKHFNKGTKFQNVFKSSLVPVTQGDKDNYHGNRKNCVFCEVGNYDSLNHVVPINNTTAISSKTDAIYLAPGCSSCNKKYDYLELKQKITLYQPITPQFYLAKRYFVLQE